MSKLVISGYYGFGNAGDEAMLAAILEAILEVIPDANITVISGNPDYTSKKHGVKAIGRFDAFKILAAIKNCDLLISGGGSLLQDVTSNRSLYYYLSIIKLATFFKRKVMLYAQGIGPIRKAQARKAVARVVNDVTMITVRDEKSKIELENLGVSKPPMVVTADAVLSMHPVDETIGKRLLKDYKLTGVNPRIGVSVRNWKNKISYRQELATCLSILQKEKQADIIFIPMHYPDDVREAKEIASLMDTTPIVLDRVYTTTELLALTGSMDIVVGVRLHALVFASLMDKPVIGISYDPKINNFLHMIGKEPIGTLENLDGQILLDEICEYIENVHKNDETVAIVTHLREESLKNAHIALELLTR